MVKSFLKIFFNNLIRHKIYTIINLLGLAIAIAVSLFIFLYVHNEYQYDKFINNRSRIYRLESFWAIMPSLPGHVIAQESKVIDKVVRLNVRDFTLNWKNTAFKFNSLAFADTTFFSIFNFQFIAGNPATALKVPNSIVLTESYAKKVFGDKNPINEMVVLDKQYKFIITGIIRDPVFFHMPFNAISTIESLRKIRYEQVLEQFDSWDYPTYLLAKPGFSKEQLTSQVVDLLKKYGYGYENHNFHLSGLDELYFNKPLQYEGITLHGNKQVLQILISIAILILIIAAINFINLTTARGSTRAKEIGIRKVSGSLRIQLLAQFIVETVIVVIAALFIAFLIIEAVSPLFCNLVGKKIAIHTLYSSDVFVSTIILSVLFGIVVGAYPSLFLSSFKPVSILKGKHRSEKGSSFFREGLVLFQLIISVILISAALQVYNQLKYMNNVQLGFNKDHVVCLRLNNELSNSMELFKDELLKQPGIIKVSFSRDYPGREWSNYGSVTIDGQSHSYKINSVDPDYFETLGIEVIEGRNFSPDKKSDINSTFLINQTAVKKYQLGNAIGKFAGNLGNGSSGIVIGIVKDFNFLSLHNEINPVLFYYQKENYRIVNIKIAPGNIGNTISGIRKLWYSFCPSYPFEYQFLDEAFNSQYKADDRFGKLIGLSSLLAIFIACLGILGLAVFSTENRIKEIGIRKANGASVLEILFMFSNQFTKWVIVAFFLACPVSYFILTTWLENYAYKSQISWMIFILAGFITYIIALATVVWQSYKVAKRNPVESLRYE